MNGLSPEKTFSVTIDRWKYSTIFRANVLAENHEQNWASAGIFWTGSPFVTHHLSRHGPAPSCTRAGSRRARARRCSRAAPPGAQRQAPESLNSIALKRSADENGTMPLTAAAEACGAAGQRCGGRFAFFIVAESRQRLVPAGRQHARFGSRRQDPQPPPWWSGTHRIKNHATFGRVPVLSKQTTSTRASTNHGCSCTTGCARPRHWLPRRRPGSSAPGPESSKHRRDHGDRHLPPHVVLFHGLLGCRRESDPTAPPE